MRRHFSIFGRNKREFAISLWIGILGSLLWFGFDSQLGHAHDAPLLHNVLVDWWHHVGFILIAVVSWLCALNAWRDSENNRTNRRFIGLWLLTLTAWLGFRLLWFDSWRQTLLF